MCFNSKVEVPGELVAAEVIGGCVSTHITRVPRLCLCWRTDGTSGICVASAVEFFIVVACARKVMAYVVQHVEVPDLYETVIIRIHIILYHKACR